MTALFRRLAGGFVATGLALSIVSPASAADSITLKIGYPAGGGYDLSGRLFARHFGRFLEGHPSIVVQNVPGGGSVKLTELIQDSEPADGSVIGMVNSSMATAPLLDPTMEHIQPAAFQWIGSLKNESSVCFTGKNSGVETLEDFRDKDILIGASNKASTTYLFAALAKNLLGANYNIVTGFQGARDIDAAIARGEIAGRCSASYSSLVSLGQADSVNLILQLNSDDSPETANVPLLSDIAATEGDRQAVDIVTGTLRFHHPFMLPSATPPEIVAEYRAAFDAMVMDPEFLADAAALKSDINPTGGAKIEKIVKELYAAPDDVVARARELIR